MFRRVKIFCFILIASMAFSQEKDANFSLAYPEFIPYNSSFNISLTVTNSYPEADEFELLIIPENKLTFNYAKFRSVYESFKLNYTSASSEVFFGETYSIKINLDDSLKSDGIVFQILLNLKAEQSNSSLIKFKGTFREKKNEIAYLSSESFEEPGYDNFVPAEIKFYKPQKAADKSLSFSENSRFQIDVEKKFTNNFLMDFWIKFDNADIEFLTIFRKNFPDADYILSINNFQMLSVSSVNFSQAYLKPYFIGTKSWYHISILVSKSEGTIFFYCNGILVAKNQLPPSFQENDLRMIFENLSKENSFMIDLLRIVDLNNSINTSFNNRHSVQFISDSSTAAAVYKLDSSNEFLSENKNVNLETSNVKFVKSDAPLFARSPELNLTLLGNSYELEWKGGDYKQAQSYILEKSTGTGSYIPVHTVQADNTQEKSYFFIDVVDASSEIVYYRVKQQNYDGSLVYSSQVKVGQGTTEPFTIGQNYPNPFNPKTSIEVELLEDTEIEITIYSLDGRQISKLFKGALQKGLHRFSFDGEGLPSGIYLYKVQAPHFSQTKKMILTK